MFFYKITVRSRRGSTRTSKLHYRECLKPAHVGEAVASFIAKPGVTSLSVTKISQKAYVKAGGVTMNDYSHADADKAASEAAERRERGEAVETFRVVEVNNYLGREEEWSGLSLGEAAIRMDDLTGVGADLVLSDFDEDCTACNGHGVRVREAHEIQHSDELENTCGACHGTGKRREPWEWEDDETGREVTLRREVE
jgi:hypothetical protein